jgi:hypothetical protein
MSTNFESTKHLLIVYLMPFMGILFFYMCLALSYLEPFVYNDYLDIFMKLAGSIVLSIITITFLLVIPGLMTSDINMIKSVFLRRKISMILTFIFIGLGIFILL